MKRNDKKYDKAAVINLVTALINLLALIIKLISEEL